MISNGVIGIASRLSIVPRSVSRVTDKAAKISMVKARIVPRSRREQGGGRHRARSLKIVPGPLNEIDEHVFQRWRRALPNKTGAIAIRRDGRFKRLVVAAGDMQAVAERRHHADAGTAG